MTPDELQELQSLTGALYRVEQAKMRVLVQEEIELRHHLARLDEDVRQIQALPEGQMTDLRRIGADVSWQAWVAKTRRNLQIELARVLARKGALQKALKTTFGRDTAVTMLARSAAKSRADQLEKQRMTLQQGLLCLTSASRDLPPGDA